MSYPIKYGILKLTEPSGWPIGTQEVTRGYIVSKCYLVREIKEYQEDGNMKKTYQVVFPYRNYYQFKIAMKSNLTFEEHAQTPNFNAFVTELDQLYDDYESAKNETIKLNGDLQTKLIVKECSLSNGKIKDVCTKAQQRINDEFTMCNQYEQYIASRTEELEIKKDSVKKLPSNPI